MASSSVSFRISRSAEDLASTIHLISQRLVQLEQRLEALELQLNNQHRPDPQEISRLENVDRLLLDCRALLELDSEAAAQPVTTGLASRSLAEETEAAEAPAVATELEQDQDDELLAA